MEKEAEVRRKLESEEARSKRSERSAICINKHITTTS